MVDPNPVTGGKGIRRLKRAGIEISFGRYGERIAHLNRKYIKAVKTGLPYITLKTAQTLDGKIAARDGSSKWISGERSRKYVKKIRSRYDAIIIGTNTLLKDDPFLLDERKKGYNVRRVVIDSELKIPLSSNIIRTADKSPVLIVITEKAKYGKIREVSAVKGVDIIKIRSRQGRVSLRPLLKNLYRRGIINVMLEGGGELAGSFLEEELIDEIMFFISPKLLGGPYNSLKGRGLSSIGKAVDISEFSFRRFNGDLLITGRVKKR
jgi:diaminohydroxyphosphoribosylaminopyrimidine deaminase/5-amino-6-(5-phosphoribosylamino)uracil reductase